MVMGIVMGYLALCVVSSLIYVCVAILNSHTDDLEDVNEWRYPAARRVQLSPAPPSTANIAHHP